MQTIFKGKLDWFNNVEFTKQTNTYTSYTSYTIYTNHTSLFLQNMIQDIYILHRNMIHKSIGVA